MPVKTVCALAWPTGNTSALARTDVHRSPVFRTEFIAPSPDVLIVGTKAFTALPASQAHTTPGCRRAGGFLGDVPFKHHLAPQQPLDVGATCTRSCVGSAKSQTARMRGLRRAHPTRLFQPDGGEVLKPVLRLDELFHLR